MIPQQVNPTMAVLTGMMTAIDVVRKDLDAAPGDGFPTGVGNDVGYWGLDPQWRATIPMFMRR